MMKWFGAILLICATTVFGFLLSFKYSERPKEIRRLISSLQLIEAEMIYNRPPLNRLFSLVSHKVDEPFRSFYDDIAIQLNHPIDDFNELWERKVTRLLTRSSLNKNDIDIFKQFGQSLGQYDMNEQQKRISLTIDYLNRHLDEAIDERDKYEKLLKSVGFLSGVFIVIIFI